MNAIVLEFQQRLAARGHDPGPLDGDLGPKTYTAFLGALVGRNLGPLGVALGRGMAAEFRKHEITTPKRICHWTAQAAHETGSFKWLTELGGAAYFRKYDGRADLGNTQPGDGARFRGRGIFQLTGRANYTKFGRRLGIDLASAPERAAEPEISVALACLYWSDRKLNTFADADDVRAVTKRINGGYNGLADREKYLARAKALWSI